MQAGHKSRQGRLPLQVDATIQRELTGQQLQDAGTCHCVWDGHQDFTLQPALKCILQACKCEMGAILKRPMEPPGRSPASTAQRWVNGIWSAGGSHHQNVAWSPRCSTCCLPSMHCRGRDQCCCAIQQGEQLPHNARLVLPRAFSPWAQCINLRGMPQESYEDPRLLCCLLGWHQAMQLQVFQQWSEGSADLIQEDDDRSPRACISGGCGKRIPQPALRFT